MGCHVDGLSDLDAAGAAVQAIDALGADLGIPRRLRDIGGTREHFPEMARLCVEANYNRWNPRTTSLDDFVALFEAAY
jgi:alcohol dehydrogenase